MFVRQLRSDTPARRAVQKADLDQERFVDFFDRVLFLGQGCSQRVHAHRAALIFLDDGQQQLAVHFVEAVTIDLQHLQRGLGGRQIDLSRAPYLGIVTHTAQQTVGDTRSAAGAAGNFERSGIVDLDCQESRPNAPR